MAEKKVHMKQRSSALPLMQPQWRAALPRGGAASPYSRPPRNASPIPRPAQRLCEPAQKEEKTESGLPEVEIILKGLLAEKGVEGFMVFNDAGACAARRRARARARLSLPFPR